MGDQWCDILSLWRFVFSWANCWHVFRTCLSVGICADIAFLHSFQVKFGLFVSFTASELWPSHSQNFSAMFETSGLPSETRLETSFCAPCEGKYIFFNKFFFFWHVTESNSCFNSTCCSWKFNNESIRWSKCSFIAHFLKHLKFLKIWHLKLWGFFFGPQIYLLTIFTCWRHFHLTKDIWGNRWWMVVQYQPTGVVWTHSLWPASCKLCSMQTFGPQYWFLWGKAQKYEFAFIEVNLFCSGYSDQPFVVRTPIVTSDWNVHVHHFRNHGQLRLCRTCDVHVRIRQRLGVVQVVERRVFRQLSMFEVLGSAQSEVCFLFGKTKNFPWWMAWRRIPGENECSFETSIKRQNKNM